jgi:2-polyprenyl-3-methyl-5-hydroxy-6-metoxy-1,4-benzoquinol methylase
MLKVPNKTVDWRDLAEAPVLQAARSIRRFLWSEFTFRGQSFAVNGVLRRRFYLRRLKMWEYARGFAACPPQPGYKILDFGGGGTLPPFFAASVGAEVCVIDIDRQLAKHSSQVAQKRNWSLSAHSFDLSDPSVELPADWRQGFHAIYSFCVLEHIPYTGQQQALKQLAKALRPGGCMVLTFEYGSDAPGEAPWRTPQKVEEMLDVLAEECVHPVPLKKFEDNGMRFALDKRHPDSLFTFGMLVLEKPRAGF